MTEQVKKSVFKTLNAINVNEHVEQKNGLSYLSWAWAWAKVKENYPDATYKVYEWQNSHGCPQNYFTDGRTCWVKTGVTINGLEHIEELPVMDFKNKSIPFDAITSMDVNKAIQRSLTKAVARHGLGLYIYAGEDLPEEQVKATPEVIRDKVMDFLASNAKAMSFYGEKFGVATIDGYTPSQYEEIFKQLISKGRI